MFVSLGLSGVFVSLESERRNREGEKERRERERQFKESKLSCENTSKRKGNKRKKELPVLPSRDPVPRMRINVPNKTGLMLLVSFGFSRANSCLSLH